MAPDQDLAMTERSIRVEAHYVDGPPPELCYVAMYTTDSKGQWLLVSDWTFDGLGGTDGTRQCHDTIVDWLTQLLR